jgi:phosphatidylserine/phosphatidylglycerophosphate/cardiolipin synthase-like enzyme
VLATLLADWRKEMGDASRASLIAVLETTACMRRSLHDHLRVESVWSGPSEVPMLDRKSMQAMFDVIDAAQQELLLSSYVVHDIASTVARLRAASDRGVRITMVVEADKQHGGTLDYSGLAAAGLHEIQRLALYYWPLDKRHTVDGKYGLLHAKCIVADRRDALVGSANLTEHAFHRNIELGVRVTGGTVPESIVRQFEELIRQGVFREYLH